METTLNKENTTVYYVSKFNDSMILYKITRLFKGEKRTFAIWNDDEFIFENTEVFESKEEAEIYVQKLQKLEKLKKELAL